MIPVMNLQGLPEYDPAPIQTTMGRWQSPWPLQSSVKVLSCTGDSSPVRNFSSVFETPRIYSNMLFPLFQLFVKSVPPATYNSLSKFFVSSS